MSALAARAATRIFVATEAWTPMLARMTHNDARIAWLPVPSNVPVVDGRAGTAAIHARYAPPGAIVAGHFGTYGEPVATTLADILARVLGNAPEIVALLIGRGSREFRERLAAVRPELAVRMHATGGLPAADLSRHLAACDLMIQPYPDGISGRRTSAMAMLQHGRPLVTTRGLLTEPLWTQTSAVQMAPAGDGPLIAEMALALARDSHARARIGDAGRKLYDERFALSHTIAALRSA
jgi:glycosyltransferase involved in cell wall biosynthesis